MAENARKRISKWDVSVESPVETKLEEESLLVNVDDVYEEKKVQPTWSSSNDCKQNTLPIFNDSLGKEYPKLPGSVAKIVDNRPSNDFSRKIQSPNRSDIDHNAMIPLEPVKNNITEKDSQVNRQMDGAPHQDRDSNNFLELRRHQGRNIPSRNWNSPNRRNRSRSWSRSWSRSRSRSRSWSRSRSRSWSRGRSRSPIGAKHRQDRWVERRRTGPGPVPCRDFAAGRCRRGAQCRFLHDDRGVQDYDRHSDKHDRDSRYERGRYPGYDIKEKLSTRDQNDFIHKPSLQRHGIPFGDGDLKKTELNRSSKSTELCFDFTKGRCYRGSACRYLHHEGSTGGWSKDDSIELINDRKNNEVQRTVNDTPCIYFAEGRCRRGQSCKFSHQGTPFEVRPHNDEWIYNQPTDDITAGNASNQDNRITLIGAISPQMLGGNEGVRLTATEHQNLPQGNSQHPLSQTDDIEHQNLLDGNPQKVSTSQVKDLSHEVSLQNSYSSASTEMLTKATNAQQIDNSENQSEMNSANNMQSRTPPVPGQNFARIAQSHFPVPHLLHGQIPGHNIHIPQVVPPMPFNGQMHPMVYMAPLVGQKQTIGSLASSNLQQYNPNIHNQPFLPSTGQSLHSSGLGLQIQQNAQVPPNQQIQQNLNHNPLVQNQLNANFSGPILQNIGPTGQSQHNFNSSQSGQSLQNAHSHDGQNQQVPMDAPTELRGLTSKDHLISKELAAGEGSQNILDVLEVKPTPVTSDAIIGNKVVSSEQAAKITNLSASLAQFFGNAALHTSAATFPSSQSLVPAPPVATSISPSSIPVASMPVTDPRIKASLEKSKNSNQLLDKDIINEFKHENIAKHDTDSPPKKVTETETRGETEDADGDERAEDTRRSKDAKAVKMFKCTLVEFVKDILKPIWKEGQLSKEAHKIIVKKVVDKVTSAMPASNIPSTQEKIDSYLAHSKAKLSKLVQAYVEKYVKN